MKCEYNKEEDTLNILLSEEIDISSCKVIRDIIDGYIIKYTPKECVLDLKKVNFMDSSGIGLIMGRYNLTKMINSKMTVKNVNSPIRKILEMSALSEDINIV